MLSRVDGTLLPGPPWHTLSLDRVLQYYDGPRLLLQRSQAGQLFLAWWSDGDESVDRWIYLPVSDQRLENILSGQMSSLDGLHNPEDGYIYAIDVDVNTDAAVSTVLTTADSLPGDALPMPGAKLSIPMPTKLSRVPSRHGAHLIGVRLENIQSDPSGRVGAKAIGQMVGNIQRLVDALGQAVSGNPTSRGNISSSILEQTRLDPVFTYTGSFGLYLEGHQTDNLFGESLVRSSLDCLFSLMEIGDDLPDLVAQFDVLKTRVARTYNDFLSTIESSLGSASVAWIQPGGVHAKEMVISRDLARNIIAQIESAIGKQEDIIEVDATLIAGNMRTLRFEVLERESGERFDGPIHEDALLQMESVRLRSHCMVRLLPSLQVVEATGEQRTTYTLLEIESLES